MPTEPIELFVRRHSHVLLHVVSLVARRGFHLEELVCEPTDDHRLSRIWLRVRDDGRRDQLVKQLEKLYDVLTVAFLVVSPVGERPPEARVRGSRQRSEARPR